jgi:hypothetical protein
VTIGYSGRPRATSYLMLSLTDLRRSARVGL